MAVIPVGAITITYLTTNPYETFIQDLGLHLNPGQVVDLGARYTQKQILDSTELRLQLDAGTITKAAAGTVPSLEQTHNS